MFAVRSYSIIIMSVMGTIFAFRPIDYNEEQSFFNNILKEHNKYRQNHGVPDLSFSPYMSIMRKRYLNKITFNSDGPRDFGVNKFSTKLSHDSILDAKLAEELVKSWYKKGENYNYLSEPLNNDADEFTQIVWLKTIHLTLMMGVENDELYVMATYFPKGNIEKKYMNNVINPQNVGDIQLRVE